MEGHSDDLSLRNGSTYRAPITWDAFSEQCNLRFRPPILRNKLGELVKLKQTGSVDDYQRKFEQLSARAGSLTVDQEIEIFLSGLHEYIAVEVELHQPRDLATAMSLARLYERRSNSSSNKFASFQVKRMESVLPRSPFVKRLSPSEIADRISKGLCFNCDERSSQDIVAKALLVGGYEG
ncbi:Retrotransposon gag protein [Corchorus olitorius]|uniref:Retrotransposon gag protein n=1 Tax=Corchorus olitorius TaxID=93759 RepID=A0A1R3KCQ5_9ROSI|nr:Retrotransposon gag protein [Corchorus olitorius]